MAGIEHCQFYVERKKRHCRMSVKKNRAYCGEHEFCNEERGNSNAIGNERIPCPLDSTHTICKSKLSKHLKVCNAKVKYNEQPAYVVHGINLAKSGTSPGRHLLSEIDQTVINVVIDKVNKSYEKLPEIPEEILRHQVLETELSNPINGIEAKRHLLQTSSLLGHLVQADLVNENTCFIEFGAGRGKLSYWLVQLIKDQKNSSVLLIDRSSHRHKRDNKLKNMKFDINVNRIRVDIGDVNLSKVPQVNDMPCKVAYAKHICGVATDLTFRCMTNLIKNSRSSKIGMVIAFCCHHRCEYSEYVGHEYLEREGFTPGEFSIISKIASWATCGIRRTYNEEYCDRESIGQKTKALLNWGRLEYLKSFGFDCRLVHYVDRDTTLENTCIVATYANESASANDKT